MALFSTLFARRQKSVFTRAKIGHCPLSGAFVISKDLVHICDKCQINLTVRYIVRERPHFQNVQYTLSTPDDL